MPFPEVERVIYDQNPLTHVICQLRFPPILRIDAEIPAAFQDLVRASFPNFTESQELGMDIPSDVKGQIPSDLLRRMTQDSGIKNYEFASEDRTWRINLTRTFLALTATNYKRWEQFEEKLRDPLQALIQVYSPAFFTRVGLRYIDVIQRSTLGLAGVPWTDLLKPYVLGILGTDDVGPRTQALESRYEIALPDGKSIVRLVTTFVPRASGDEERYKIDSDFFTLTKVDIRSVWNQLQFLRLRGSRLFQWCITDRLHLAMEPQKIC